MSVSVLTCRYVISRSRRLDSGGGNSVMGGARGKDIASAD